MQALSDETADRFACAGQVSPVRTITRCFHRKDKSVRRLVAPLLPARGLEGGIIRAVDLDGGQTPAGEFKLVLLRQTVGIENPTPWPIGPPPDSDANLAWHGAPLEASA